MDAWYLALATAEALKFEGATAPNPPVGACIVRDGQIFGIGAHARAGEPHAEIVALNIAKTQAQGATLYVTLEPCNHHGRTGPCVDAIARAGITRVVFGARDLNPNVTGKGAERLKQLGIAVEYLKDDACDLLVAPFLKWATKKRPWILHKLALRELGGRLTAIPPSGSTTFAREASLVRAHTERRKSDAILTTLPTILADRPQFTVRHVPDHGGKIRFISVVTSHPEQIPARWIYSIEQNQMKVLIHKNFEEAMSDLGEKGVLRCLVEAGPTLSSYIQENKLFDEQLLVINTQIEDFIFHKLNQEKS